MTPLAADLLFLRAPTLLPQAVLIHVKQLVPGATMTLPTAESPAAYFAFPGTATRVAFMTSDQAPPPATYADALVQNDAWVEAAEVVAKVRSVVTLAELPDPAQSVAARTHLFALVLAGCARALGADGACVRGANRLLSPAQIDRLASDEAARSALAA